MSARGAALLRGALAGVAAAGAMVLGLGGAHGEDTPKPRNKGVSLRVTSAYAVEREGSRLGFVSGRALAGGASGMLDVVFALDGSEETAFTSGVDVNGDGTITGAKGNLGKTLGALAGIKTKARGGPDSVLAAQVVAVETLLRELDDRATRVGIVVFAGGADGTADDAWSPAELSDRYARVRIALRELLDVYSPGGSADLPAGLRAARLELLEGRPSEECCPQQRIVLVADGYPQSGTETPLATEQRALNLANLLRKDRIRVDVYAVGPLAQLRPRAATKVAEYSGGSFMAVDRPGDLINVLPRIDFAEIDELRIVNVGSGKRALEQAQYPDGGFSGLVPLREGENEIEVYARASNGDEKTVRVTISGPPRALNEREQLDLKRLEIKLENERQLRIETDEPGAKPGEPGAQPGPDPEAKPRSQAPTRQRPARLC